MRGRRGRWQSRCVLVSAPGAYSRGFARELPACDTPATRRLVDWGGFTGGRAASADTASSACGGQSSLDGLSGARPRVGCRTPPTADAGISLRPSTLLIFGNPPLGTLFIAANPLAGLDWPVRLLVFEDEKGGVWTAYTDFGYIARRHEIKGMDAAAFEKASGVIASITSSVKAR